MQQKRLFLINNTLCRSVRRYGNIQIPNPKYVNTAQSGEENFLKDYEKSHVQTNLFQKVLLGVGSGLISFARPHRGDMIAVMGEITGPQALQYMRSKMMLSREGRKILEEKPRVSSGSVDLEKLKNYPEGTLGKAYSNFLVRYGYSPDTRNAVRFVDDFELAYVAQRYREAHDLFHTLLDMPTNMLGEVTVKWVEAIQTRLPMCAAGALFGSVRLAPKFSRTYSTKSIIKLDSDLIENIEKGSLKPRHHPGVMNIPCVSLPEKILIGVNRTIKKYNHPIDISEGFHRQIEGRHLPIEESEKVKKRKNLFKKFRRELPEVDDVEEQEEILQKAVKNAYNQSTYNWEQTKFDEVIFGLYLLSRSSREYAVVERVLNEIAKRDKDFIPEHIMDFGSGVGTVSWAANKLWGDSIKQYHCIDSSLDMQRGAEMILKRLDPEREPCISNVLFTKALPQEATVNEIVISAFTFFELPNKKTRMKTLGSLWSSTKDYLILIENGSNQGFEVILEARDFILNSSKLKDIECHVFAPCSNDFECPRPKAPGKKTPCNFEVKFSYLPAYKKFDEVGEQRFCYLIIKKGPKPFEKDREARIVRNVIHKHRHSVCEICTNQGKLERLYVSASKHGKPAYKCIRNSKWGDLIPGNLEIVETDKTKKKNNNKDVDYGELHSDSDSSDDEEDKEKLDTKTVK